MEACEWEASAMKLPIRRRVPACWEQHRMQEGEGSHAVVPSLSLVSEQKVAKGLKYCCTGEVIVDDIHAEGKVSVAYTRVSATANVQGVLGAALQHDYVLPLVAEERRVLRVHRASKQREGRRLLNWQTKSQKQACSHCASVCIPKQHLLFLTHEGAWDIKCGSRGRNHVAGRVACIGAVCF